MVKKDIFSVDGVACYQSKPCSKCGTTTRYANNRNCVECKRRANANREAVAYRNSARGERVADGSMRDHIIRYFKRGGTLRGAPANAMEWELTRNQLLIQREVIRVMKNMHSQNWDIGHKYPVKPYDSDPYAIRSEDGVLMIGRHVASNLTAEKAAFNRSKGNSIQPGKYSASQLTPLVLGEFLDGEGKQLTAAQMFDLYDKETGFEKSGILSAEERESRRKCMEQRKQQGITGASVTDWEYVPAFKVKVYRRPEWTELKGRLIAMYEEHKSYGSLEAGEGLRVALACEMVELVELAIERERQAVEQSGEIETALDWCWLAVSNRLDGQNIEPLYLPLVDSVTGREVWRGVKVATDGFAYETTYNATGAILSDAAAKRDNELSKMETSAQEYFERFQRPLPRHQWDIFWKGLLTANSQWSDLQFEWRNAGLIYKEIGKMVIKGDLETMRQQVRGLMGQGLEAFPELADCTQEAGQKDWRGLTNGAGKYVDVLGYPSTKASAWIQGVIADQLDGLEGLATVEANNKRIFLLAALTEERDQNTVWL